MAFTVSIVKRSGVTPTGRTVIADITFDSSYSAGGEAYTPAMFGLSRIDHISCNDALASATTGLLCLVDHTNSKLMLFGMAAAAGVGTALTETNVANQAATTVRAVVYELPHV